MVSPVLNETFRTAEFLISEARGYRSRDFGNFDNTTGSIDLQLVAGTVVMAAALGAGTFALVAGAHGNPTAGTVTVNAQTAQLGTYTGTMTSATAFNLVGPDGRELAPGTFGTAYSDELGLTITAGGTAMQAGDSFTFTVATGSQLLYAYDGTKPAIGIVYNSSYISAGTSGAVTLITRDAEVNLGELVWASGINTTQQAAALAQLRVNGIVARA